MPVTLSDDEKIMLTIFQVINLAFSALFLTIFSYRYHKLRPYSMTNKYIRFYPHLRVIMVVSYIFISVGILVFSLIVQLYGSQGWYAYLLVGGGGPCINSVVLVIELFVLRSELIKERPYTRCHVQFFSLLAFVSITRFILGVLTLKNDPFCITNSCLSAVLLTISVIQLGYWLVKRQSLPKFNSPEVNIQDIHNDTLPQDFSDRHICKNISDDFPYLIPFVNVEDGQLRIILQLYVKTVKVSGVGAEVDEFNGLSKYHSFHQSSYLARPTTSMERTRTAEYLSSGIYSIDNLKQFYTLCGRFPLQKKIEIQSISLPELSKDFQQFLQQLFQDKRWYQSIILCYLKVPDYYIQLYLQLFEQESDIKREEEIDLTTGLRLLDDKNSLYCSVLVYKHLWVTDHYEFYIKLMVVAPNKSVHHMKRYSEFQDLHHSLKQLIKAFGRAFELPLLPKKHLFYWNQDEQIAKRRLALQKYLRSLINDYTLMQIPPLRAKILSFINVESDMAIQPKYALEYYNQLKVIKGKITKVFVRSEYVTFYEFKLFHNGIETKDISKRYTDFEELHIDLSRWMNNIMITFRALELPEKVYFKSESIRHEKLRLYLQSLVEIREVGKVYAANQFFNVYGNEGGMSEISAIEASKRSESKALSGGSKVLSGVIEMQHRIQHTQTVSSNSSRFSKIIDDLGNESYDRT